jgi:hypothetical protein
MVTVKHKQAIGIIFFVFLFVIFFSHSTSAIIKDPFNQGLKTTGGWAGYTPSSAADSKALLFDNLGRVIKYGFLLATGIVYMILLIYAGFTWMKARGSETEVTRAKEIIIDGTVGLIVVVAAYAISYIVISSLQSATLTP